MREWGNLHSMKMRTSKFSVHNSWKFREEISIVFWWCDLSDTTTHILNYFSRIHSELMVESQWFESHGCAWLIHRRTVHSIVFLVSIIHIFYYHQDYQDKTDIELIKYLFWIIPPIIAYKVSVAVYQRHALHYEQAIELIKLYIHCPNAYPPEHYTFIGWKHILTAGN